MFSLLSIYLQFTVSNFTINVYKASDKELDDPADVKSLRSGSDECDEWSKNVTRSFLKGLFKNHKAPAVLYERPPARDDAIWCEM